MKTRIKPLQLIVQLLEKEELPKSQQIISIEEPHFKWAYFMAETVVSRYGPEHWNKDEKATNFYGYLGEKLFESILLQYKIPNLHADPIYKEFEVYRSLGGRPFDFYIPGFGTIETKTAPPDQPSLVKMKPATRIRFMANKDRWDRQRSDYAAAIKIDSEASKRALLSGYLKGSEVEQLPVYNFGLGDAYWTFLDPKKYEEWNREHPDEKLIPLRPASELMKLLLKHSIEGSGKP